MHLLFFGFCFLIAKFFRIFTLFFYTYILLRGVSDTYIVLLDIIIFLWFYKEIYNLCMNVFIHRWNIANKDKKQLHCRFIMRLS